MTAKVIDASALAAMAFLEAGYSTTQKALADSTLHAPALLYFEMANICVKKLRASSADRGMILSQYDSSLAVKVIVHDIDLAAVVKLADETMLSAYDASYLWLSKNLGCELITLDEKLAKAFAKTERHP